MSTRTSALRLSLSLDLMRSVQLFSSASTLPFLAPLLMIRGKAEIDRQCRFRKSRQIAGVMKVAVGRITTAKLLPSRSDGVLVEELLTREQEHRVRRLSCSVRPAGPIHKGSENLLLRRREIIPHHGNDNDGAGQLLADFPELREILGFNQLAVPKRL